MNRALLRMLPAGFLLAAAIALFSLPVRVQADGAAVFKAKCAPCHGADGSGETTMGKKLNLRDLRSADVQKQSDAALTTIITDGKEKMPAYKDKVSAADIKDLVATIRDLAKKK